MRSSHARADDRLGGTTQLEFSLPRSHAQTALWPERARAASPASNAWALAIALSVYQLRNPESTMCPPDITRKRLSRTVPPIAHVGIQFTPLMWPVNRVGMIARPARSARSDTVTSRWSIPACTVSGAGWKSSQSSDSLTESKPFAAIRAKSSPTSVGSNAVHQPIAVRAGQ